MRTKIATARATMIAALSLSAGAAHAVPIVFEFTGTVTSSDTSTHTGQIFHGSRIGQTVSGRITLETQGLVAQTTHQSNGMTIMYFDPSADAADLITSELFIGGERFDLSLYSGNGGHIRAFDSNDVNPCVGCSPSRDAISLRDTSSQPYWDEPPGESLTRDVALFWSDSADPLGLVDLSDGFDPLAWLPLMNTLLPTGSYTETTWDCVPDECSEISSWTTRFSISSITVSAANVPEPGTLALFAVGLLGVAVGRRRQ